MPNLNQASFRAHTNIALIKYWGKRDPKLFLPVTSSLSLTLEAFYTDTRLTVDPALTQSSFYLNGIQQEDKEVEKLSRFLHLFYPDSDQAPTHFRVDSYNHVPTAAGLASSASAFAALGSCANQVSGLNLGPEQLSTLVRQGSGSASRSLFGGFVRWNRGQDDQSESSFAQAIDSAQWDIGMLAIAVNADKKAISSRKGMLHTMETSPFYQLWPKEVAKDLEAMEVAIQQRDVQRIGEIAEHNAMKMHATILAANPSFTYFEPDSLLAMQAVRDLREAGYCCYYTMDAGPNVKVIAPYSQLDTIKKRLAQYFTEEKLIMSRPGPAPYAIDWKEG
ncbi:diphosphomevalonate decarboxylase [Hutsoniella sourekii]|uniref:diphosphomevalonate decarboxylase n=1 Tax=Hutsoniella sourekii TaxID=87650 RepID=UPI00047F48DA|nr:diphosphomevalonate decarboxylase [Hutsoniella sourekii]